MKKIINKILSILDSIARANAAAALSREGYHKEARALLTKD